ncbi:Dabb family protein [Paenibacillus planticolens]|uniref:Dabb family protein n=1 Tax=Paenibacillus planticolens TaxID=2654976 RepID=A0ABX1ZMD7_9BACL|nr:Dabb family protein [Paenibacillus planticolens]NOV00728.1 Dabb family protein [Paenibacillus planticolens]
MFEHLVCFRFKETLAAQKEQELIETLLSFKGRIPGIVEISAGANETEETDNVQGYTLGLRVTFEDRESLRQYGPHPVHQEFVKSIAGIIENVIVIDYPVR